MVRRRAVAAARGFLMVTRPGDPIARILDPARRIGDEDYAAFVARTPFARYERRISELGLTGLDAVADVGCGYGHWTAALARRNRRVIGLDPHAGRLGIAAGFAATLSPDNCRFARATATALPLADRSLDALFCYGVFMFLDRRAALDEFHRVLRPGGLLYVCTNAAGWWLRLLLRSWRAPSLRASAFRALVRPDALPNATSRAKARALLSDGRWSGIETAREGHLGCPGDRAAAACYAGSFLGIDEVVEFRCARRRDLRPDAAAKVRAAIDRTLNDRRVDRTSVMRRHPQPHPATDLVENCDRTKVLRAIGHARKVSRVDTLRGLFARLTRNDATPADRVRSCVAFAQRRFLHHFAGQPMRAPGVMLTDPIALLLLGEGRCGHAARFLVDLFECGGMPSRLLAGGGHTCAEVLAGGKWLLCDANLYPPGVFPVGERGEPLGTDEAARRPELLDRPPSYIHYHHEHVAAFLRDYPETEAAIGDFLRAPILPASGFFGAPFFSSANRTPGRIERLRKSGSPEDWEADPDFGWGGPFDKEALQAGTVPVRHRPGQVCAVERSGGFVRWAEPFRMSGTPAPRYRAVVDAAPPAWEYDLLPIDCRFDTPGQSFVTTEPVLALSELRRAGSWLRIAVEIAEWEEDDPFYLPSRAFFLD